MSKEVINASIKFFENHVNKESHYSEIVPFGGEPLMEKELLKHIIESTEYLSNQIKGFHVMIFTNLTLMDRKFLEYIKQYPYVRLSMSVDGNKQSHDECRIYPDGSGSYDDVIKSFELYKKVYGLDPDYTLSYHSCSVLSPDNYCYYLDCVNEYRNFKYGEFITWPARDIIWSDEDINNLRIIHDKATDIFIEEYPKNGLVDRWLLWTIGNYIHNAVGNCPPKHRLSVIYNGDIYPCQRFEEIDTKFKLGDVFNGINESSYSYMADLLTPTLLLCKSCKYGINPGCRGQCLSGCLELNKSVLEPIDSVCLINKINYDSARKLWCALRDNDRFQQRMKMDYRNIDFNMEMKPSTDMPLI
jgi:radical SAM protein with 4Fe4S-binding SPASM domain